MLSKRFATAIVTISLIGFVVACMATIVHWREGNLAWDDADYLRRGLRIANRAALAGPRAPFQAFADILRERPKPPLLVAWLATSTIALGRQSIPSLILAGSVVPFASLLLAVAAIAKKHFGGRTASIAVLATVASPLSMSLGAKVMVETFLSLFILLTLHFAARTLQKPSVRTSLALGCSIGLAMLTKLTVALLLPGPALLFLAMLWFRNRQAISTVRTVCLVVACGACLVAGPWYARNGRVAIEFARFSSRYNVEAEGRTDSVQLTQRLVSVASTVIGWPNLLVLTAVVIDAFIRHKRPGDFSSLAITSFSCGAVGLLLPSYFDPRFLSPAWPSLAVALAGGLLGERGSHGYLALTGKGALVGVLTVGAILTFKSLVNEPGTRTYWAGRDLVDQLVANYRVKTIGNVGDTGDWNVCKTGLMNELRPHPEDCFVLQDLSRLTPESAITRLERLDALVVLGDSDALRDVGSVAPGLNRVRTEILPAITNSNRFRRVDIPVIADLPPMSVYVRR